MRLGACAWNRKNMPSDITINAARRGDFITARHGALNVTQILGAHAGISILFYGLASLSFWTGFLPALLACWIHQKFISEWVHEAAHYNLVPDKKWNDILANTLLCWWHGYKIAGYRAAHMRHHSANVYFAAGDPDTERLEIGTKKELWISLFKDISGYTAVATYFSIIFTRDAPSDRANLLFRMSATAQYLLPIAGLHLFFLIGAYLGGFTAYYLFYMFCLVTVYSLLNRIRVMGQHLAVTEGNVTARHTTAARTINAGIFDRIFITSRLMMYHHEHHAKPALPYRALTAISKPSPDPNVYMDKRWPLLFTFIKSLP